MATYLYKTLIYKAFLPYLAMMNISKYYLILMCLCVGICQQIAAQDITITEINYKSAASIDAGDWVELYNFGSTPIAISGWSIKDSSAAAPYVLPNYTLAAGARVVLARTYGNFVNEYSIPNVLNTAFGFKLNGNDSVILKNNVGATVVAAGWQNNLLWPRGADGEGRTLQSVNEMSKANLGTAAAWTDGCVRGSPGIAPTLCNDPIIFTEINYNSNDTFNVGEFIELYNTTNAPIDISGFNVRDEIDSFLAQDAKYVFPANTILPANGYAVICNDSVFFKQYHSTSGKQFFANFEFNLDNSGEMLRIFNKNNVLVFSMHYDDTLQWTDSADAKGYTLELIDKDKNFNSGTNWRAGCKLGSPFGPLSSTCKPVFPNSIKDVVFDNITIYPNPLINTLHIGNASPYAFSYTITDLSGKVLHKVNNWLGSLSIDISNYVSGIYLLQINNETGLGATYKMIKE
jgi:hypothetical protein